MEKKAAEMENCYSNFSDSLKTEYTRQMYALSLRQFRSFAKVRTYEELLTIDVKTIQDIIIAYIKHMKEQKAAPLTIRVKLAAVKHFMVMNDAILNWPKIMKFVGSSRIMTKDRIYLKAEIQKVLEKCDERKRVMFLLLISTGIRIGALPGIRIQDLTKLEPHSLYRIVIYAGEHEEYIVFTTIECAKAIDAYLAYRVRSHEVLKPEAPLIREQFNPLKATQARPVALNTIMAVLTRTLEDAGVRQAGGNANGRHDVMPFHGFRKFTNTMMAQAGLKQVIKEMLMGHRVGLEKNYLRPTDAELLSEYMKAIDLLTISEEKQLQVKVEKLQVQNDQLIDILKSKIAALERANATREIMTEHPDKLPKPIAAAGPQRKRARS